MDGYVTRQEEDEYIDLRVLLVHAWQGFRKFWWAIPIAVIICLAAGYWYMTKQFVPMYEAKGTFTVSTKVSQEAGDGDAAYEFFYNKGAASQMAVTFPYIIKSEVFQDVLLKELGTDEINGDLSVESIPDTNLFTITVTSTSADDAYQIVQAVMNNYPTVAKYVIGDTKLTMLQKPVKPDKPYNSLGENKRTLLKFALLGFLLGILPTGIYAITRKQIHSREDIKEYLNMDCLGAIRRVSKKKRSKGKTSLLSIENASIDAGFIKSMKRFAYKIGKEMDKREDQVVLITSTNPEEGKSMTAYNLSRELSAQGKNVVLIHGDIRKQKDGSYETDKMHKNLKSFLQDPKTMVAKLEESRESSTVLELAMIEETKNPIKLLQSESMQRLVQELKEAGEYIVIDSPPVGLMADAMILARYSDGVVYVVRQDYMNRGQILNGIASLASEECNIYGCVLNYATEKSLSEYGRYYDYQVQE